MSVGRARRLRKDATATERLLWGLLRGRNFAGLKFRRQMPIGPYVVDFVCVRHRLVIEADGPFHDAEQDRARDRWLASEGFRILRFTNAQVTAERITAAISATIDVPLRLDD